MLGETLKLKAESEKAQKAMGVLLSSLLKKSEKDDKKLVSYCKQIKENKDTISAQKEKIEKLEKELTETKQKVSTFKKSLADL